MRSRDLRRFAFVAAAAAVAISCSLVVDTNGLSGGADGDDGAPPDGSADAVPDVVANVDAGDAAIDGAIDAALGYRETVLADGPIAYYRLADTGSVAKDETGAHNGAYANTGNVDYNQPGPAPGVPSVRFKGTSHVSASSVATVPVGTLASYTLEMFILSEVAPGTSSFFLSFSKPGGGGGPVLFIDDTTETYRFSRSDVVDSTIAIGGGWHHLAMTASGTTVTIYVDGQLDVSGSVASISPDRGLFTIGANAYVTDAGAAYTGGFDGRLAEVAIYGKALTPAQIAAHYAARP